MSGSFREAGRPARMMASDAVDGSPPLPQNDLRRESERRATMRNVTTIGLDIAKNVFQCTVPMRMARQ
jgi:hypothetical protein